MRRAKRPHVYIMTNRQRSHVLYTGITDNLVRRVWEHKNKIVEGFTSRYSLTRLVYYECFFYPDAAINREKEIKGWRRSKKIRLVESMNPHWHDLAERWSEVYKPDLAGAPREIPRPLEKTRGFGMTPSERGSAYNLASSHIPSRKLSCPSEPRFTKELF